VTNRSKQIGTAGETAVVRYAREHGFPLADRRVQKGRYDEGDVLLTVGAILEVKSGKAAATASYNQKMAWLAEAETERVNARADVTALVVQRNAYGTGRVEWWEFWWTETFPVGPLPACCTLANGLLRLRHSGWGDPL
jgi:Holliday junction resolvase-like predicted endonuclease